MAWRRRSILGAGLTGAGLTGAAIGVARAGTGPGSMPIALTIATGEPGGGFALYGAVWGQQAGKAAHVTVSYRASGGSAANILLVEQNAAQLGLTTLAVADQAWRGRDGWTGNVPLRGFRALFPVFDTTWQIYARAGGSVRHLDDLAGRRIGVGPAGGGSAVLTPALLAAAGISPRLSISGLYDEQIDLLRKREIDACAFLGVTPLPAIRQDTNHDATRNAALNATLRAPLGASPGGGFNLIGVSGAQGAAMRRAVPGLSAMIIPRMSLPGQSVAVTTIGSGAIAIGRADLPDALVGRLTEAALSQRTALIGAGFAVPDTAWIENNDPIAIHPGAADALRRHGFAAPARLVRS
ncbi:MAG: TAXI family TRAP transporter solute-binding subunit [Acidiphilium sp.]|nr:TAXI family TRAP transporter solute-binding subunit [Acidiphilium sp.]MDD4935411.1 TAXI family TRAP transporter solute-binding subunit [Acidiphilium sp.]